VEGRLEREREREAAQGERTTAGQEAIDRQAAEAAGGAAGGGSGIGGGVREEEVEEARLA
jgi:hypothetical protein